MSADRWKTLNALWRLSPEEFKTAFFPDNPAPFGRAERAVFTVLFAATFPQKQHNGNEARVTNRIAVAEIAKRAGLTTKWTREALKHLQTLEMIKRIETGEKKSRSFVYKVWHLAKS